MVQRALHNVASAKLFLGVVSKGLLSIIETSTIQQFSR